MQDQILPVSFSLGLDEKSDSKSIPMGKLLVAENLVTTKQGLLQKRNGLLSLGRQVAPTGETIVSGQAVQTFEDQLLLFNGVKAYSYTNSSNKWISKGNVASVINESSQIVRNGSQQANADGAKVDGLECYAWEDTDGGIHYSVIDSSTGNFLVSNQLLTSYGSSPKVLKLNKTSSPSLASQFVILFANGPTIQFARIFTDAPIVSPVMTTATVILHENQAFDATESSCAEYTNGVFTTEFDAIFVAYAARKDVSNIYLTPKVLKITASSYADLSTFVDSAASPAPSVVAIVATTDMSSQAVAITGPSAVILYYSTAGFSVGKVAATAAQLAPITVATPDDFELGALRKISLCLSEPQLVDKILMKVFFEFRKSPAIYTYIKVADFSVQVAGVATAASSFQNIKIKKGVGLYSKGFLNQGQVYLTTTHESYLQSTYFVLNASLEVVSKFNENNGGGMRNGLSEVISDGYSYSVEVSNTFSGTEITHLLPAGNGIYSIPTQKKGKIESENNTVFTKLGLTRSTLDFVSENHFLGATLNDNLYTVGGILQNYDGNKFTEAGFNLYPEALGPNHGAVLSDSQFIVITTTFGDPSTKQEYSITCVPGSRLQGGDVVQINSANNAVQYYIWFRVDGVGTDPAVPGLNPLLVSINSYYTSSQVAASIASVLNLTGDFLAIPTLNVLGIQNTAFGPAVPPAALSAAVGNIAAGTYNYIVIWKYIDNKGRIHPSATSIPETIIVGSPGSSVSITVPLLGLTTKQNVILEVYRTENLGSLYRRVSSTVNPTFNIDNDNYLYVNVSFTDTLSDADMLSNELVYTTGDVLDNDSPPACSLITTYDNRLWIAGMEDKNSLQFSKVIDPLNKDMIGGFSEALAISFLPQGGAITAIAKMDEKLIVFKSDDIYYISGTGPSNANDSNNYNAPILITADVGCSNPNSVVLMPQGLMFKSKKGIYLLDRSLSVSYLGAPVEAHNYLTISSSVLTASKNQVRFTTEEGVALIYDYAFNQWSTFTNYTSTDADLFQGKYILLSAAGLVRSETADFKDDGLPIVMAIETGNLSLAGMQGYQRLKRVMLEGGFMGAHNLKVSLAYNFSPTFTESTTFSNSVYGDYTYGDVGPYGESDGDVYGGKFINYQCRVFPTLQKCTSFRIRVEDDQAALAANLINEGYTLSNISLVVGVKTGQNKISASRSQGTS